MLLSSFSFAALASGATIVVAQSVLPARGGDAVRRRCALLAVAAMAMAAVSAVQATLPSYGALSLSLSLSLTLTLNARWLLVRARARAGGDALRVRL